MQTIILPGGWWYEFRVRTGDFFAVKRRSGARHVHQLPDGRTFEYADAPAEWKAHNAHERHRGRFQTGWDTGRFTFAHLKVAGDATIPTMVVENGNIVASENTMNKKYWCGTVEHGPLHLNKEDLPFSFAYHGGIYHYICGS